MVSKFLLNVILWFSFRKFADRMSAHELILTVIYFINLLLREILNTPGKYFFYLTNFSAFLLLAGWTDDWTLSWIRQLSSNQRFWVGNVIVHLRSVMILFLPNKYVTDDVALLIISQGTLFLYITVLRHPPVDKQCTRVCYRQKLNSKIEIIRNVVAYLEGVFILYWCRILRLWWNLNFLSNVQ